MPIIKQNLLENFHLTSPEKILYPESDITKLKLANFYFEIQGWILPHIINRPLTFVRCPDGRKKECFFQKHVTDKTSKNIFAIDIKEKEQTKPYPYVTNISGLIAIVQMSVLEIHLWNCHINQIEKPDMFMFDLDPGENVAWKEVIKAAFRLREILENYHLVSFVKTSGGKGLHVVVPIKKQKTWEAVKLFSQEIVLNLVAKYPNEYLATMTKAKRHGKIFIDFFRNQRGATAIAPYSTRAKIYAPIATPLAWNELNTKIKPDSFTVKNLMKRLKKLDHDPWEDFFKIKQTIKV